MGLPVPKETKGTDLSACITGEADTEEGALMMCTGLAVIFGDGNEWRVYRTKQYTYAIFKSDGQEFLFDDKNDPYQMENVIDNKSYREIAEELKSKMYAKMNEIGDSFENVI